MSVLGLLLVLWLGWEARAARAQEHEHAAFQRGLALGRATKEISLADVSEWIATRPIPQLDWLVDRALATQRAARELETQQQIDALLEDVRRLG